MTKEKSLLSAAILTFLYCSVGMYFISHEMVNYGIFLFVLLPISLGIVVGSLPFLQWVFVGIISSGIIFLLLIYINKLEGIVCILMSIPIVIPLVVLGVLINWFLIRMGIFKPTGNLKALILPLLVFMVIAPLEKIYNGNSSLVMNVKTERIYPYSCMQVYDAIKSVDTLIAEKPFLMKLDLPVPNKCILEKEEVGGLRTCYFSGGKIVERITELEKGKVLRMDVIDYKLTGRKWLGFNEAIYFFEKTGRHSCKMTRITTYSSKLKPRFYWEPLERLGIAQEHQYVFDNLENDLRKNTSK